MLAEDGYDVGPWSVTVERAVETAEEPRPDLVVLDVKMPVFGRHSRGAAHRRAADRARRHPDGVQPA